MKQWRFLMKSAALAGTLILLSGCLVAKAVGTAADVAVATVKVPIKAGAAVVGAASGDDDGHEEEEEEEGRE